MIKPFGLQALQRLCLNDLHKLKVRGKYGSHSGMRHLFFAEWTVEKAKSDARPRPFTVNAVQNALEVKYMATRELN